MQQVNIPVGLNPNISVHNVSGDLRVAGWDRNELMAKTDADHLDVASGSDPITIACYEDLILYIPRNTNLIVERVSGDASLQALQGPVSLGPVSGDLTMNDLGPITLNEVHGDASLRNVGAISSGSISGDLVVRGAHGPCTLDSVSSDASLRDVDGVVTIQNVGSDLYVRNIRGGVHASVGNDAALYVDPKPGQTYDVTAGNDLIARLSPEPNVKLHLTASSPESIQVDFPGVEVPRDCSECHVTVGPETPGMPEMILQAGDDLLVTSAADPWESAADFGKGMRDGGMDWPLPPDFSERINRRVQAAMERANAHLEAANRRAEAAGQRASVKIEAAMRRAEAKARAAEVRARRGAGHVHANINVGRWNWDLFPGGEPEQTNAPVSDDERLTILKMLQEKKISLEEAEKLLAALEGK